MLVIGEGRRASLMSGRGFGNCSVPRLDMQSSVVVVADNFRLIVTEAESAERLARLNAPTCAS